MILRMALVSAMFVLTFGLLHGASYTAIGYGNTIDEAKNEALVTLASQLSSRVRSTQRVVIKETTAGKRSEESQLFVHDAQVDTSLELLGVRLDAGRLGGDGRYQINAFLDEQALPLYLGALGEVKRYIDDIERRELARLSYGEQQMLLLQLLRRYEEFETYATISRALDGQAVVPELERTKAGVELDYWNLLSQEAEALQLERTQLQDALSNAQMRDAASLQLQAVMAEINKNQAAQQVWQEEQVRQQQESLQRTGIQIQAIALGMQRRAEQAVRRAATEQQQQDPLAQISAIEQKKQAFRAIEDDMIEQIAQQRAKIDQRYAAQIEEERGRPYRAGEMLAGRPTEAAQRFRLERLDDIRRMQDDEVTQMERQLRDSASPALQQLKNEIVDGYKHLEKTTFALDSIQDSVMIKVGAYNGLRNSWPVAIRLSILNQPIPIDLYVPFESMTGERVPDLGAESARRHEEYERYLDSVDLFEAYFSTADIALTGSISYRIYVGENPSEYGVVVESVTLRRTDTGETIYSHKDSEAMDRVMYYRHDPAIPVEHWYTSRLTQYHRSEIRKAENALSKSQRREALNAMMEKSTLNQSRMAMVTAGLTFARMEGSAISYPFTLGFEATYRMPFSNRLRLGFGMDLIQMAPEMGITVYGTIELMFPLYDFPRAKPYGSAGLMGFVRGMFGMWYEGTDEEKMEGPHGLATLATGVRYVTPGMWLEQRVSVVLAGLHQGEFSTLVGIGVRIP
jgi:hypothetical protein